VWHDSDSPFALGNTHRAGIIVRVHIGTVVESRAGSNLLYADHYLIVSPEFRNVKPRS
jgi:hypothetical protein